MCACLCVHPLNTPFSNPAYMPEVVILCSTLTNYSKWICHHIYLDATAYSGSNYFGTGVGRIELNKVDCTGRESTLLACHHSKLDHHCSHSNDAGVRCEGK